MKIVEHPVLIPTSEGPVGGIVSEPQAESRARMLLLPGYGRPARSGTNSFWTRTARALAELGVLVLRYDYSREGETLPIGEGGSGLAWKRDLDLALLREVEAWFSARAGDLPLLCAGACAGTRMSIEIAAERVEVTAGVFLVAFDVRPVIDEGAEGPGVGDPDSIDPLVVERLQTILEHAPAWVLVGEHDIADIPALMRLLGPTRHSLELVTLPGITLHFLDQPDIQSQAGGSLIERVARALEEPPLLSRSRPLADATS